MVLFFSVVLSSVFFPSHACNTYAHTKHSTLVLYSYIQMVRVKMHCKCVFDVCECAHFRVHIVSRVQTKGRNFRNNKTATRRTTVAAASAFVHLTARAHAFANNFADGFCKAATHRCSRDEILSGRALFCARVFVCVCQQFGYMMSVTCRCYCSYSRRHWAQYKNRYTRKTCGIHRRVL